MPNCACSNPEPRRAGRRFLARLAAATWLSLFAHAAAAAADWKSVDYVVDSFVDIALGSEHGDHVRQTRKWLSPIRYAVVHHVGDADLHARLVRTHFAHLAALSGLSIRPVTEADRPNFLVVMTAEPRLREDYRRYLGWTDDAVREKFFREAVCVAVFANRRDGSIVRAAAVIPVDRARSRGKLLSCIVEELTQALGLPNDSDRVFPSVFNDRSVDNYLSGLDATLVRLLYSPGIRPGMAEAEARQAVRSIAEALERDGAFARADREARSSGVSALVP